MPLRNYSLICRLREFYSDPQLLLSGSPIPVVEEVKFLGIIFDKTLSFLPHLRYLKDKCTKALNLLRVVAHNIAQNRPYPPDYHHISDDVYLRKGGLCRLRKFHSDSQLLLNGSPIPVVEEVKFVGIIFDKKTLISSSLALLER